MTRDILKIKETERLIRYHSSSSPWKGAKPQYPPDTRVTINDAHFKIDLRQLKEKTAHIVLVLTVEAFGGKITEIVFNAINLEIKSITNNNNPLPYNMTEDTLVIEHEIPRGKKSVIKFEYTVEDPLSGLYFVTPLPEQPHRPYQVWTQGETEQMRYWVPLIDSPSHLFTSRVELTVPKEFTAISNGRLEEQRKEPDGSITFDWVQDKPIPLYLLTLTVGEFTEYEETEYKDVPLKYYADKRYTKEDLHRSFKNTPKFMDFFIKRLGKYPWDKYYQVVLEDFSGAMENTSSTSWYFAAIQSKDALAVDPRGIDPTNIHELAHQWFGDLIVIKHWPHTWVKEGIAVYLESLYWEETIGRDEFLYDMYENLQNYLAETKIYQRAIVENRYHHSWQLYDDHTYPGGAWRYHMIRNELEDRSWWLFVRHFLNKNEYQTVDTTDLIRAIEEVTGKNMQGFFDQWLYRAGHPKLKVSESYDKKNKMTFINIEQEQAVLKVKKGSKIDPEKLFMTPIEIGWLTSDNTWHYETYFLQEVKHVFSFKTEEEPQVVLVDPRFKLLKELDHELPVKKAEKLLEQAPNIIGRIFAVKSLCDKLTPKLARKIMAFIEKEEHWGTRRVMLNALAGTKAPSAEKELLSFLQAIKDNDDYQLLSHVILALGKFESNNVAIALIPFFEHPNTVIASHAGHAAAATQSPEIIPSINRLLERESLHHVIHYNVASGLGKRRDSESIELLMDMIMNQGLPAMYPRFDAVKAIRQVGEYATKNERAELVANLQKLLHNENAPHAQLRVSSAITLCTLRATEARYAIESFKARVPLIYQHLIQESLDKLGKEKVPKEMKQLRKDLEELRKEKDKLADRVAKLEAREQGSQ
ncbi:MAG: M1 family aminopeptidase [Candidatus Hodarchaeales archaeon]|jgi:aminopeptidase N